jgi:hypothetical protein
MKKYFEYDKVLLDWIPKGQAIIITNIDELRLDHYRLQDLIDEAGGIGKFFTVDYQKALVLKWGRLIYIIDEAHKFFDDKLKNKDVEFFFQYHRHLGVDMYLVTTGVSLLPVYIQRVIEYRIQAVARSKQVGNTFLYDKVVDGEKAGKVVLTKRNEVFKLYKSMDMSETEKPKSLLTKYVVGIAVMVLAFGLVLIWMVSGFTGKLGGIKEAKAVKKVEVAKKVDTEKSNIVEVPLEGALKKYGGQKEEVKTVSEAFNINSSDFEKVNIFESHGGGKVFITESGRLLNLLDIASALKYGQVIGGQVFIKRIKEMGGNSVSGPTMKPLTSVPSVVLPSISPLKEKTAMPEKKEPALVGSLKQQGFKGGTSK